ncbi:20S proteasome chaperone assembly proteins 3 and 4 [Nakaseomyces glabratus]|nr:20S proteasome chaperone assembly proteins 3 and 4 [Nakaseomyces glabratus]KAH7606502.1 20S proteasome chaperone assembly proteins 3 and 4 [Nakaseomyces glabratus]KAH7614644.1 20S proteasome chaperone assembly proteins 3 and 4 [Nakaseomyces glabratus]
MQVRSIRRKLDAQIDAAEGEVGVKALHYSNSVVLQIRYNGEFDSTYEVNSVGLRPGSMTNGRPLALNTYASEDNSQDGGTGEIDEETEEPTDYLADYKVVVRLGNGDDPKMNIVCSQIAELYNQMQGGDELRGVNLVISLSRKLWKGEDSHSRDFAVLVFLLQCIKDMYV